MLSGGSLVRRFLQLSLLGVLALATSDGSDVLAACFDSRPGSANRSHITLKVARRDWISQQLVTALAHIVLAEYLGYTVEIVHRTGSSSNWGEEISTGAFDIDLEQWQASDALGRDAAYREYVTQREEVIDAGVMGYHGRSGLYTFRSALQLSVMADYYKYYQNATAAATHGFVTFVNSSLPETIGDSFPQCRRDVTSWCGDGIFEGYWAPPACREDPTKCLEIAAATPEWDVSYFEQLVKNTGVQGIFAYYGSSALIDYIQERANKRTPVMFYWFEPHPVLLKVDAVRISFPDFFTGCDRPELDTRDANTGQVTCDFAIESLRKLISRRAVEIAPQAYYFLLQLSLTTDDISELLLSTEEGGGTYSTFDAACSFVKRRTATIRSFAPLCISNPAVEVRRGDQVFNNETLTCENATVASNLMRHTPVQCFATPPGNASRQDRKTVRVVRRDWLSHDLVSMMMEVLLREYLGFTVEAIDHAEGVTSDWGIEMIDMDMYDIDMEQWQVIEGTERYRSYIDTGLVHIAGLLGFAGRAGIFVTLDALGAAPMSDYFKFYWNASIASSNTGFVLHADLPPMGGDGNCFQSWCGTGNLDGYWSPPQCESNPGGCLRLIHVNTLYDTGYVEQMVKNNMLEVIVGYYGRNSLQTVRAFATNGHHMPFYWWEPDVALAQNWAVRVSFPDHYNGCDAQNDQNPELGALSCDFPEVQVLKIATHELQDHMAEAFYVVQQFEMYRDVLDGILYNHIDAGGSYNTSELVCNFLASHSELVRTWAPDCLTNPIPLGELEVGITLVFNPELLACAPVTPCPNNSVLRQQDSYYCDRCRAGQVPDEQQTECESCRPGSQTAADGSRCEPCGLGTFKGDTQDECQPCFKGRFADREGLSECEFCSIETYENETGSKECTPCNWIITGSITNVQGATKASQCECPEGFFLPLDSSECAKCPEGMSCAAGSSMANLPSTSPSSTSTSNSSGLAYPQALSGFMTTPGHPLRVYRCNPASLCPGGAPGTCATNHDPYSVACGVCTAGSYLSQGVCRECGSADWVPTLLLLFGAVVAASAIVVVANRNILMNSSSSLLGVVLLGLVVTVMQIFTVFREMSIEWFDPLESIFNLISVLTFDLDVIRVSCVVGVGRVRSYALRQWMAPASVPVLFIALLVRKQFSKRYINLRCELVNSVGLVYNTFFISIVLSAVSPLACYSHPGASGRSVVSEPSILCTYSGQHIAVVTVGIVATLLVPVPFLVLIIFSVRLYPLVVYNHRRSGDFLTAFRFLFVRFHSSCYWFGLIVVLRGLLVCLVPVLVDNAGHQVVFLALLICLYVIVQQIFRPWRSDLANFVDLALSLGLILLLLCISVVSQFPGDAAEVKLAATVGLVAFALIPLAVAGCAQQQAWKAAVFDFFICHHKEGAGAQARLMKMLLVSATSRNVFLDSDNLVELDGLFEIVKTKVRMLVVYLTRATLQRPWCVGEVCTAFEHQKRVVTVQTSSWEQPSGVMVDLLPTLVDTTSCNLIDQGISEDLIARSLRRVVGEETRTIKVNDSMVGVSKFTHVAAELAGLAKSRGSDSRISGSLHLPAPDALPGNQCVHRGSELLERSMQLVSLAGASPESAPLHNGMASSNDSVVRRLQKDPGGLVACADDKDDEAIAAVSILTRKLNQTVVSLVGSRFVDTTSYDYEDVVEDTLAALEVARAVVVLLSRGSLEASSQVTVIVGGMKSSAAMIPVNTWDFNFPSASYYDRQLPQVWEQRKSLLPSLQETQTCVRSFFKLITIFLSTMGSDQVLTTQSENVLSRIPKEFDLIKRSSTPSAAGSAGLRKPESGLSMQKVLGIRLSAQEAQDPMWDLVEVPSPILESSVQGSGLGRDPSSGAEGLVSVSRQNSESSSGVSEAFSYV